MGWWEDLHKQATTMGSGNIPIVGDAFDRLNRQYTLGEGLPWGPAETGAPDYEALQNFNMDPNAYGGFNSSDLRRSMEQNLLRQQGLSRNRAMAMLQKQGVKGADRANVISDLEAQTQAGIGDLNARLSYQDYLSRVAQRDAAYNKQKESFAAALARYQQEKKDRQEGTSQLLGGGGQVVGGVLKALFA